MLSQTEQDWRPDETEGKPPILHSAWIRYGLAAIFVLAALGISHGLAPLLGGHAPFVCFVVASLVAAWVCGLGPGLAALASGFLIGDLLFVLPLHEHKLTNASDLAMMLMHASVAGVGLASIHSLHQARVREQRLRFITTQLEREVVERRRAETALGAAKERLDFALEAARMWTWDLEIQGCVFEWSPHHEAILGPRRGAFPGTCEEFLRYIHPEDRGLLRAALSRCIAERADYEQEYRIIWTDGSRHWILAKGKVLRDQNDVAQRFYGIMMEITERKRAEEALREAVVELSKVNEQLEERVTERTAKLQEAVRSLEGVLYHVAHDLRAPLRAMVGFSQILMESVGPFLDEEGRDAANRIIGSAKRLDRLILDLLAYGRLGHVRISLVRISLEEGLNHVLAQLDKEIKTKHAKVEIVRPLPMVRADHAILETVLQNILENALTFVAPGVEPRIRIWPEQRGANVRLWIQDNGIGIDAEHRERIFHVFERLYQAHEPTGTGIGLAIVFKGMERMGGLVGVESKPGAGSRFWLELPAYAGKA